MQQLLIAMNSKVVLLIHMICFSLEIYQITGEPMPLLIYEGRNQLTKNDRLERILGRVGPNIRAATDFHDFTDQTVEDSLASWQALESQIKEYARSQVDYYKPKIALFLAEANVSSECRESTSLILSSIKRLDSWAIQIWNSFGHFPPTGLMDGGLNELGSYHNCINLKIPETRINHTSYCTLGFRPIIPPRRAFHMIFQKEDKQILQLFDERNILRSLANRAQYFHYIYMRTAICAPLQCSPYDVQQVALLIARRLFLNAAPVKCFTRATLSDVRNSSKLDSLIFNEIENEPVWIEIEGRQMTDMQLVSLVLIVTFYVLVTIASIWHWLNLGTYSYWSQSYLVNKQLELMKTKTEHYQTDDVGPIKRFAFNYLSVITNGREFLDTKWKSSEITCLHGLRVITMIWIIIVHCLQYNEWSGFSRAFEIERILKSPFLQPIFNANYVVDNFFFMSGLLASFSSWSLVKNRVALGSHTIRIISNITNRYLRLTPQVMLVSMFYVLLPLLAHGPFWYDVTEWPGKYCEKNWWINLLHIQAFYREGEICNLVSWWISVDMFFYLTALFITYLVLTNRRTLAVHLTVTWMLYCTFVAANRHYQNGYPPNNLGVVPQIAEAWTGYVTNFYWSPFTHAYSFYSGLWLGYVLANNRWRLQVQAWSRTGTIISASVLIGVNMSSYIWMSGRVDIGSQWISTLYNVLCPILWVSGLGWFVISCHYGYMPNLNRILSIQPFVLLSKASFIIYLSHMIILRIYFGIQATLIEVSLFSLCYMVIGNIFLSILFGIFLCITFEGPSMKFQKWVARKISRMNQDLSESQETKPT